VDCEEVARRDEIDRLLKLSASIGILTIVLGYRSNCRRYLDSIRKRVFERGSNFPRLLIIFMDLGGCWTRKGEYTGEANGDEMMRRDEDLDQQFDYDTIQYTDCPFGYLK
jgi:hypothetical protein